MLFSQQIRFKRDGRALQPEAIRSFIREYASDMIPDYQMAAMLMAVFFRGLNPDELWAWTDAMLRSGDVMDFSDIPGAKVDKHSTGGVGDKISIPLAPLVASARERPDVSGRGLGHTGGTLDKLESYRGSADRDRCLTALLANGVAMLGQTENIVPADKRMYSLRDVTGTVESIPLIAASIMSKKLAEGISGLVLDVKVGSGAFMKSVDQARELARTLVAVGQAGGVRTTAFLTDMDEPLGNMVGNALEIVESVQILRNEGPVDTTALTVELGARMLLLGGVVVSHEEGRARILGAIASGAGLDKFRAMIAAQGGNPAVADDLSILPRAARQIGVKASGNGYVTAVDCEKVGIASLLVGGGRRRKEDEIDPAVGVRILARRGTFVSGGDDVAVIEYNSDASLDAASKLLSSAFSIGDEMVPAGPLVIDVIDGAAL